MNKLIIFLFLLPSLCFGANPTFQSFNGNQFSSNTIAGVPSVSVKNAAVLTNTTFQGAGGFGSAKFNAPNSTLELNGWNITQDSGSVVNLGSGIFKDGVFSQGDTNHFNGQIVVDTDITVAGIINANNLGVGGLANFAGGVAFQDYVNWLGPTNFIASDVRVGGTHYVDNNLILGQSSYNQTLHGFGNIFADGHDTIMDNSGNTDNAAFASYGLTLANNSFANELFDSQNTTIDNSYANSLHDSSSCAITNSPGNDLFSANNVTIQGSGNGGNSLHRSYGANLTNYTASALYGANGFKGHDVGAIAAFGLQNGQLNSSTASGIFLDGNNFDYSAFYPLENVNETLVCKYLWFPGMVQPGIRIDHLLGTNDSGDFTIVGQYNGNGIGITNLVMNVNTTNTAPVNAVIIRAWVDVIVNGQTLKMPLYQ